MLSADILYLKGRGGSCIGIRRKTLTAQMTNVVFTRKITCILFRVVRAERSQYRRCMRWAVGDLGNWKGWDNWVKGGTNRVSIQAT
jgi:hypothetical protein